MSSITTYPSNNVSSVRYRSHVGSASLLSIPSRIYHHSHHQLRLSRLSWCLMILQFSCESWCRTRPRWRSTMLTRMMWNGYMKISICSPQTIEIGMWSTPVSCTISVIESRREYRLDWEHWPNNTLILVWIRISKGQTGESDLSLNRWCSTLPSMLKYCPMSILECLVKAIRNLDKDLLKLSVINITWRVERQETD